jgi:hypothetical protein
LKIELAIQKVLFLLFYDIDWLLRVIFPNQLYYRSAGPASAAYAAPPEV